MSQRGDRMEYKIIASKRKTIALQMTAEGELIVRCPLGCDKKRIEEMIEKHAKWIENARKQAESLLPENKEIEVFYYLGNAYKIKKIKENKAYLQEDVFFVAEADFHKAIEQFLKNHCVN